MHFSIVRRLLLCVVIISLGASKIIGEEGDLSIDESLYPNLVFNPQTELKTTSESSAVPKVNFRLKQPRPSIMIYIEEKTDRQLKQPKPSTMTYVEAEGADVSTEGVALSDEPSEEPTEEPSEEPTFLPSAPPTFTPTISPTVIPSWNPTTLPTVAPSMTTAPSVVAAPSFVPTTAPTADPSGSPTTAPSAVPSRVPTASPSTSEPTLKPFTFRPSPQPVAAGVTAFPTVVATEAKTDQVVVNTVYEVESVRADFLNPTSTSTLQSTIEAVAPQPSTVQLKSYKLISTSVKSNAWHRSPSFSSAASLAKVLGLGSLRGGSWSSGSGWSMAGEAISALHSRDNMKLAALIVYKFAVESDIIFNLVDYPSDNVTSLALRQTTVLQQTVFEGTFTSALRLLAVANNATQLLDALVTNVTTQATVVSPSSTSSHHSTAVYLKDWHIVLIVFGTFFGFFFLFYYLERCFKAHKAAGGGKKYQSNESSFTPKFFPKLSSHPSSVLPTHSDLIETNYDNQVPSNFSKVTSKGGSQPSRLQSQGHENAVVMSQERYRELQL